MTADHIKTHTARYSDIPVSRMVSAKTCLGETRALAEANTVVFGNRERTALTLGHTITLVFTTLMVWDESRHHNMRHEAASVSTKATFEQLGIGAHMPKACWERGRS